MHSKEVEHERSSHGENAEEAFARQAAPQGVEIALQTGDVLELFAPELTREELNHYVSSKAVQPVSVTNTGSLRPTRTFGWNELQIIQVILRNKRNGRPLDTIASLLKESAPDAAFVPANVLQDLMQGEGQILVAASFEPPAVVLQKLADLAANLIDCESFELTVPGLNGELALERAWDVDDSEGPISFSSTPGGGRNLRTVADLAKPPLAGSLAMLPPTLVQRVRDRKGILRGTLIWRNRLSFDRKQSSIFDRIDHEMALKLSNLASRVLNQLQVEQAQDTLAKRALVTPAHALLSFLKEMLEVAHAVLGATRGELFWYDGRRDELVLAATTGAAGSLGIGTSLPKESICFAVSQSGKAKLIADVRTMKSADKYYACSEDTVSEIAFPLKVDGKTLLAVINFESTKTGYFSEQYDLPILERFNRYAAFVGRLNEGRKEIFHNMADSSSVIKALEAILQSVRDGAGFNQGIVCIADDRGSSLRVAAVAVMNPPPEEVQYHLDQISGKTEPFPVQVFKQQFPEKPAGVSVGPLHEGLLVFGAQGVVLGVPLFFGSIRLGVLIVWSDDRGRKVTVDDVPVLSQYANLAVTTLAISRLQSKRRWNFVVIRRILARMQSEDAKRSILHDILRGVTTSGFERARIFRYEEPDDFVCEVSLGVQEQDAYAGVLLSAKENSYANRSREEGRLADIEPKLRDPRTDKLGPDQHADEVGKPKDLPWAVAPMTVNGVFKGYIAADNSVSRAEITSDSLDYLAVYGALASMILPLYENEASPRRPRKVVNAALDYSL